MGHRVLAARAFQQDPHRVNLTLVIQHDPQVVPANAITISEVLDA